MYGNSGAVMSDQYQILRLNDVDYDLTKASEEARKILSELQNLDHLIGERQNMIALLTRAKNSYIADLKAEIIRCNTGVDLSTLFD